MAQSRHGFAILIDSVQHVALTFLLVLTLSSSIFYSSVSKAQDAKSLSLDIGHAELTALEWSGSNSKEQTIIALPWGGGTAVGYRYIGPLLADAGYRFIALNPRGFDGSTGVLDDLSLHDYANDVAEVMSLLGLDQAHMMGSALGNRVARAVATDHSDLVASITLIAAGGMVSPLVSMQNAGRLFGNPNLSPELQLEFAREALFAEATPTAIIEEFIDNLGYYREASAARSGANRTTPVEQWWGGGSAPMLIIQGLDDKIAPPENGVLMQERFGERIQVVNLSDAGHLMGLEKPQEITASVIEFLEANAF